MNTGTNMASDDLKRAAVKWFNEEKGFGFLLTEANEELWFHAADRRVLMGKWWLPEWECDPRWVNAPTPDPKAGDAIVYTEGTDSDGRKKAVLWGHMYSGLEFALNREPVLEEWGTSPAGRPLYKTRKGTVVLAIARWGLSNRIVNQIRFEATPEEYDAEVLCCVTPDHPQQWKKMDGNNLAYPQLPSVYMNAREKGIKALNEGDIAWEFKRNPAEPEDDECHVVSDSNSAQATIQFIKKTTLGGYWAEFETTTVRFHRDGTVRVGSKWDCEHQKIVFDKAPLTRALLASAGLEVVDEDRPITKYEFKEKNFELFCKAHKPTVERKLEILSELRQRFGWGVYPQATPAVELAVPVSSVFSEWNWKADYSHIKTAIIGIYDPKAVEEWEKAIKSGLTLFLRGSVHGPGTVVSAYYGCGVEIPKMYGAGFERIDNNLEVCNYRWELLSYASTEAVARKNFQVFKEVDRNSSTGAVLVVGGSEIFDNMVG